MRNVGRSGVLLEDMYLLGFDEGHRRQRWSLVRCFFFEHDNSM